MRRKVGWQSGGNVPSRSARRVLVRQRCQTRAVPDDSGARPLRCQTTAVPNRSGATLTAMPNHSGTTFRVVPRSQRCTSTEGESSSVRHRFRLVSRGPGEPPGSGGRQPRRKRWCGSPSGTPGSAAPAATPRFASGWRPPDPRSPAREPPPAPFDTSRRPHALSSTLDSVVRPAPLRRITDSG